MEVFLLSASLLKPIPDYFNITTSAFFNSVIILLLIVSAIYFRFSVSKFSENKLYQTLNLNDVPTKKVRLRPKLVKHNLTYIFFYLCFVFFTIVAGNAFMETGNLIMLFYFLILFSILLFPNIITVIFTDYKVKFIRKN